MRGMIGWAALAASLVLAGTANAADGCDAGDKKLKLMKLTTGDQVADITFKMVLPMALDDEDLTPERITALPRTCERGAFEQGGKTWRIFGSIKDAPVRWVASDDGAEIAYVVKLNYDMRMLNPGYKKDGWMLVAQQGDSMQILRAYKSLPDDAALQAEFQEALAGHFRPVVGYDRKTKSVQIFMAGG